MGDPKKPKKKYATPNHPFRRARIEAESGIKKNFGLKNKQEIWKMDSTLRKFTSQAKKVIANSTPQGEKEKKQMIDKLLSLGLLSGEVSPASVLNLKVEDVLNRRLQTMVVKRALARTMSQSRQFIVHGHILVGGKKITAPSYLVRKEEENAITFNPGSKLASPEHPERAPPEKKTPEVEAK